MKHEPGKVFVLLQHGVVQILLLPSLQHTRLPGGKTGLHGEGRLRGDDGIFIIHGKFLPPYNNFGIITKDTLIQLAKADSRRF